MYLLSIGQSGPELVGQTADRRPDLRLRRLKVGLGTLLQLTVNLTDLGGVGDALNAVRDAKKGNKNNQNRSAVAIPYLLQVFRKAKKKDDDSDRSRYEWQHRLN